MIGTFEEIKTIDDINPYQFPEIDYGSLVNLIELKKYQMSLDLRREQCEWAEEQFQVRVTHFERRKYFFMMFYCAIAASVGTIVGALVFWGLSSHVCR